MGRVQPREQLFAQYVLRAIVSAHTKGRGQLAVGLRLDRAFYAPTSRAAGANGSCVTVSAGKNPNIANRSGFRQAVRHRLTNHAWRFLKTRLS